MSSMSSSMIHSSTGLSPGGTAGASVQKVSTAFRKVKGNIERLFEKNLADMIRGIRNNKENEPKYIAQCMEEIKQELKQDNIVLKANAIAKLSYLQMLGYDISWAAFNIIEVMSSQKFTIKRIGYLASSQSFNETTEVVMLTTNLIRKDLNSSNMYEAGIALGGLSCFVTHDLARDLANDVVTLLTSSKPYTRKRAVLLLYKIFLRYPDALRPTFPRLKEKLEDPDQGVQSAAVNVICELARKNPKNYLSLAPVFFKLMTTSTNNWMLIKIIKLFGALTPFEPRLGKKLIEPLTNLINSTSAMSLLYECINTVIAVLISISSEAPGNHTSSIQLCVQKLSALIEDADQNLKYLGLLAMGRILQTHPKAVQVHKDLILACLDDKDESIRLRALDLLYGMVSKKNIMEIVKRLLQHVETAEGSAYRDELLAKIIQICAHNNYHHITNFEWYVSVLVELTKVEGTKHGSLIADQMLDVAVRVQSIRHFAVSQMALLIENAHLLLSGSVQHRSNMCEVLYAAAWICGEFAEHVRNPQTVLESLLRAKINMMPGHIQSVFIQNIAKLYAGLLTEAEKEDDWDRIYSLDNLMLSKLPVFEQSNCLEAQERACSIMQMTKEIEKLHKNSEKVSEDLTVLFDGELGPVAAKAQRKVPLPNDLDLESWINEPPPEEPSSESEPEEHVIPERPSRLNVFANSSTEQAEFKRKDPTEKELKEIREARRAECDSNPHYLKSAAISAVPKKHSADGRAQLSRNASVDSKLPPVVPIDLQSPLEIPGIVGLERYLEQQEKTMSWKNVKKEKRTKTKKKSKRKGGKDESTDEDEQDVIQDVNRGPGEMPEGAKSTDEDEPSPSADPYRALNINLDEPLKPEERLPVLHHRVVSPEFEKVRTPPGGQLESPSNKKVLKKKKKSASKSATKLAATDEKPLEKEKKKKTKVSSKKLNQNGPTTAATNNERLVDELVNQQLSYDSHTVDLWLDDQVTTPVSPPAPPVSQQQVFVTESLVTPENNIPKEELPKKTKSKKEKSRGGSKKEKREKRPSQCSASLVDAVDPDQHLRVIDRADYEETSGLCTPSQQDGLLNSSGSESQLRPLSQSPVPPSTATPATVPVVQELSNYRLLAENKHLRLTYETRVTSSEANHLTVNVIFTNLSDCNLSKLEVTVLDSINIKLVKADPKSDQSVVVPFVLLPRSSNEYEFHFTVQSVNMTQKLRGNLTFMLKSTDGTLSEMLDFQLKIPCISFTVPTTISKGSFADLLSSGELSSKCSVNFTCSGDTNFQTALTKICFYGHFSIVELGQDHGDLLSASLYCQTIQAHPLCLLVKQQGNNVTIDGKCTDTQIISYVLQEIRDLLTSTEMT